ncbi:MAG: (Fe-S)-binding protein [Thermodesulfobacteriota bacterium]
MQSPHSMVAQIPDAGPDLAHMARALAEGCTRCGSCAVACGFLQQHGLPGAQAQALLDGGAAGDPYRCSLCGLCGAVCPEGLAPGEFFLALRREAVGRGGLDLARYRRLLAYEARGHSRLFAWRGLPPGCDAVFFPGCALPGTRPGTAWRLFAELRRHLPRLGVALDCCHKPSHDLGRQEFFAQRLAEVLAPLLECGVGRVLTACPNCHAVLSRHAEPLAVQTVYEFLAERGMSASPRATGRVTVHDPCPLRHADGVHDAVRRLLAGSGLEVEEMRSSRGRTLCCGEGGAVGCVAPELSAAWARRRGEEAAGRRIVTYCAGCAGFLSRVAPTVHLADLLCDPDLALSGRTRVWRSPFTWLNRLRLKLRLRRALRTG